ncbi:MAG: hypothetical protein AVDCRST_MAG48-3572, partial [uncultured Friedmanniella sp.]
MAGDPLLLHDGRADERLEAADDAVHHLLAVEQGVALRPAQVGDVGVELGGALDEVGE